MGKELAKTSKTSLIAKMAAEHSVEANDFYETITQTVFKGANKAQLMTLLMVADRYKLDVTTKEIFAFPDKGGGIVPVVSIDGWISLAHKHPQYDGEELRWAEKKFVPDGGKPCPEWCEVVVYRKDTSHPTVIREYLDEVYRKTGPWQSHTKRMLRHKTMIQGYRVAFGFSGLYDEDEAQRVAVEGPTTEALETASSNAEKARRALGKAPTPDEVQDAPESPPEAASEVIEGTVEERPDDAQPGEAIVVDENGEVIAAPAKPDFESAVEAAKEALDAVEEAEEKPVPKVTRKQLEALAAAKKQGGWSDELFVRLLKEEYGVSLATELDREQALDMIKHLLSKSADSVQQGLGL